MAENKPGDNFETWMILSENFHLVCLDRTQIYYPMRNFLLDHADNRISPETRTYFASPGERGILVIYMSPHYGLLGMSGAKYNLERGVTTNSITVVHKGWRRSGLGFALLCRKLAASELDIVTTVAQSNEAGIALCQKAKLQQLYEESMYVSGNHIKTVAYKGYSPKGTLFLGCRP